MIQIINSRFCFLSMSCCMHAMSPLRGTVLTVDSHQIPRCVCKCSLHVCHACMLCCLSESEKPKSSSEEVAVELISQKVDALHAMFNFVDCGCEQRDSINHTMSNSSKTACSGCFTRQQPWVSPELPAQLVHHRHHRPPPHPSSRPNNP